MGIAYNTSIVRDGLVLHLDAANPKSYPGAGTTWFDLSGNGNNATLIGNAATVVYSSNGYFDHTPLLYFGAADSSSSSSTANGAYWSVPYATNLSPTTNKAWSVCGFLNVKGDQSGNGVGWFHKNGVNEERGIHLEPLLNVFRVNGSSGWANPIVGISAYYNKFTYYCFTYSTTGTYGSTVGNLRVYINGNLITTNASFVPVADGTGPISLGRRNGHLSHYMNAQTVGYQYYTRELAAAEIQQNFEALRGRYGI